jgi:hypothetical protein
MSKDSAMITWRIMVLSVACGGINKRNYYNVGNPLLRHTWTGLTLVLYRIPRLAHNIYVPWMVLERMVANASH